MIKIDPKIIEQNGTTRANLLAHEGTRLVHSALVTLESARSRAEFCKDVRRLVPDPEKTKDLEQQILNLLQQANEQRKEDAADAQEDAPTQAELDKEARRQEWRKERQAEYILVPGAHTTEDSYVEQSNDDFARAVIGELPEDSLYRRGPEVVGEIHGEAGKRQFRMSGVENIRLIVDRNLSLGRWCTKGKGDNAEQVLGYVPCSRDHAALILAHAVSDVRLPEIKLLTSYPVQGHGFELCRPGFHNGIFYDQPAELRDTSPETDAEVIRQVLGDLFTDFPFKDEESRQNAIGALLTPHIRPAIEGNIPGHLYNSPLERTGKTKLIEITAGTHTGRKIPATQMPRSDEEVDKRILSILLNAGESFLHLDNLAELLDSPALASLLTATVYQGRMLGTLRTAIAPNNVNILASGNNVRATGELCKRMVPILLQPADDHPENRTDFVHPDVWQYAMEQRPLVLSCLMGMVETWKAAGRPRGSKPMGGFDEWAAAVGGIMEVFGYTKWLGNADTWRKEADPRSGDLRALVDEWKRSIQGTATAADLLKIAIRLELFPDVLRDVTDNPTKGQQTAFGMRVLARNVNVPVGEWIIKRSDLTRPATYYLASAKKPDADPAGGQSEP